VDMHLMIAAHTPPPLEHCVCEKFPEGKVPPSGTVVCAKVDPAGGAVHCASRNADYRGDDGGALTWWGCRSDMPPCRIPFTQTEVLTALYESTGGKTWTDKENWLGGGEPCDPEKKWDRVTCDDDGDVVTRLQLFDNQLSGTLPSELGDLTTLTWMKIYDNSLSGTLPSALGQLTALTILAIGESQVSGSLPSQLGGLTALTYLDLRDNSLSGCLPSELDKLTPKWGCLLEPQADDPPWSNSLSGPCSVS